MYCLLKQTALVSTTLVTIKNSITKLIFGHMIVSPTKPKLFVKLRKYLVVLTKRKYHFQS